MRYLDSVALARLKNMSFNMRRHLAEGHLTGRHRNAVVPEDFLGLVFVNVHVFLTRQ